MMLNRQIKISYQGAPGAFSHIAAKGFAAQLSANSDCLLTPCLNFADVFKAAVEQNSLGVIPLENSTIGAITQAYDLLWSTESSILAEAYMPIHHQLLGQKNARLDEIKEVHSHPAALEQCRKFFASHPNMKGVVDYDTAGAAARINKRNDKSQAAIASSEAASEYGLSILQQNIEDFSGNATRFILIGSNQGTLQQLGAYPPPYKLSLGFQAGNRLQALGEFISLAETSGCTVTKMQSRPVPENPWHSLLFLDLLADSEKAIDPCLRHIQSKLPAAKILGLYPKITI